MSPRTVIGLTAVLMATAATARAELPVPAAFNTLKPYQVVEQLMAQREVLGLTEQQFAALDAVSLEVRNEKHQFAHRGGKPHRTTHVPMISRQAAFDRALAVLTPVQQQRAQFLFPASESEKAAPRKLARPHGKP
jgi:hypothetical protein